jgi:hypothetical protein
VSHLAASYILYGGLPPEGGTNIISNVRIY